MKALIIAQAVLQWGTIILQAADTTCRGIMTNDMVTTDCPTITITMEIDGWTATFCNGGNLNIKFSKREVQAAYFTTNSLHHDFDSNERPVLFTYQDTSFHIHTYIIVMMLYLSNLDSLAITPVMLWVPL